MHGGELAAWCMALGAIGMLALARGAEALARPTLARARACAWHLVVCVLVLGLSGLLVRALRLPPGPAEVLQVLAGPCCVAVANLWIRAWLGAAQRDRLIEDGLQASGVLLPLAGCTALLLPPALRLPGGAAVALVGSGITVWLTARAALLGDRLAPWMAAGCALALLALAGLYAHALQVLPPGPAPPAAIAALLALSNALTGYLLWRRDCDAWHASAPEPPGTDPVTRLPNGVRFGRMLVAAEQRRRRQRRPGALLAVLVFDLDRITAQAGTAGAHELFAALAARMQRQVGLVNPVGRYWERCFVTLVESVEAPGTLHRLSLRLARSLSAPLEVRGYGADLVRLHPDIGVGVVLLGPRPVEVEDMLHAGQALAEAARRMRSRVASCDSASRAGVPPEPAAAGGRSRSRRPGTA